MREEELDRDPLRQFSAWLEDAHGAGLGPPDTVALATATPDGRPSARMVLLKAADERGFSFFTNRLSRKGRELAANPRAAFVLHWPALGRQVRVEGRVEELPREESAAYWATRPLGSRVSAAISPQTDVVESREWLEARAAELAAAGGQPPLPDHWGGYRVVPETIELWEHREDRLHDRVRYTRADDAWTLERLAP